MRAHMYALRHSWLCEIPTCGWTSTVTADTTLEAGSSVLSSKEVKLMDIGDSLDSFDGVRLVKMPVLVSAISSVSVCAACNFGSVFLREDTQLSQRLVCSICGNRTSLAPSGRQSHTVAYNTN